jgi:hypothetical protein
MPAKKLSLADRIRAERQNNRSQNEIEAEKELVKTIRSVGEPENQSASTNFDTPHHKDHINILSLSDQDHTNKGADTYQVKRRYLSGKDHDKGSPQDHHRITTKKRIKKLAQGSLTTSLSKSQTKVFLWFQQRGKSGVFNKPEIGRSLSMPYITIRKAIKKLETSDIIELQYDACQKVYEYKINEKTNIKLSKGITIGTPIDQHQSTIGSSFLNSSSSYNKNTTTKQFLESDTEKIISEIMIADPEYTYWTEHQVTPKQVTAWKNEFGLNLQVIMNNLCYTRWQILNQNMKITKGPANYIYGIMKKTGGTVNKPDGYKSVAQQDLEYYDSWKQQQVEHAQKIARLKEDAKKAQITPKIIEILSKMDLKNKHLKAALDKIKSQKRKQTIKTSIETGRPMDDKTKSILRGYLEEVLCVEITTHSDNPVES